MLLFSSTSCITGVVSYVFLKSFGREIGTRLAKIHITYACPTFHCCDAVIKGESPYTFLSYFKRKGQNYLSCFWGRVRSCARAFRLCCIKARLFLISFGDTSLTNESIPKLNFDNQSWAVKLMTRILKKIALLSTLTNRSIISSLPSILNWSNSVKRKFGLLSVHSKGNTLKTDKQNKQFKTSKQFKDTIGTKDFSLGRGVSVVADRVLKVGTIQNWLPINCPWGGVGREGGS